MFVDFRNEGPPPEPWRPRPVPGPPRLSRRGEAAMGWIIAFNLAMLVFGPLAGASVVEAVVALVRTLAG